MPQPRSDHFLLSLFGWGQRPKPLPKAVERTEKSIIVALDHRILEDSLPNIRNHGFLDYLQTTVSHPDPSQDLKLLMENKMGTLTDFQLLDLIEDLCLEPI